MFLWKSSAESEQESFSTYLISRAGTYNHNVGIKTAEGVKRYAHRYLCIYLAGIKVEAVLREGRQIAGNLFTCLFKSSLIHRQGYPTIRVKSSNFAKYLLEASRKLNVLIVSFG